MSDWHETYEGKVAITKEVEFDSGHRVPNHASKCRNPHGHRYRVRAYVTGTLVTEPGAPDEGMLVDFGDLKTILTERVHDVLDHGFIVYENDQDLLTCFDMDKNGEAFDCWKVIVFPYIPTAENMARWIWEQIKEPIDQHYRGNLLLDCVKVWETPTSTATYVGPDRGY